MWRCCRLPIHTCACVVLAPTYASIYIADMVLVYSIKWYAAGKMINVLAADIFVQSVKRAGERPESDSFFLLICWLEQHVRKRRERIINRQAELPLMSLVLLL